MGRWILRLVAAVFIAAGAGGLAWGLVAEDRGESIRPPFHLSEWVRTPSELLGYAVGLIVLGVFLLVFSFLGGRRPDRPA